MRVVRGFFRLIEFVVYRLFILAILVGAFAILLTLAASDDETAQMVGVVGAGLLALFTLWRFGIRPIRQRTKAQTVPASILRIETNPPPGAPAVYWTYVLFESRGKRIKVHLSKHQAAEFTKQYSVGDTGMLTYSGDKMADWKPPTPTEPWEDARDIQVFVSYAHQWGEDAEYLAQFFQTQGLSVWFDRDQLRVGERLTDEIKQGVEKADYFVPLLSPEYWSSQWCIEEFELAARSGKPIFPIKVSAGSLAMPPHIQRLYREELGEIIYLDLRGRDPTTRLREVVEQMKAGRYEKTV